MCQCGCRIFAYLSLVCPSRSSPCSTTSGLTYKGVLSNYGREHHPHPYFPDGMFRGWDFWVILLTATNSLGGLLIAMVIKYADNILKAYAQVSTGFREREINTFVRRLLYFSVWCNRGCCCWFVAHFWNSSLLFLHDWCYSRDDIYRHILYISLSSTRR